MVMFSVLSEQFLFSQTVFLFLRLEQPMGATDSYFLRMFSPFFQTIFHLFRREVAVAVPCFAVTVGISGCLHFLGTQLHFKNASCALLKDASGSQAWFPGSQFPGWQAFPRSVFF